MLSVAVVVTALIVPAFIAIRNHNIAEGARQRAEMYQRTAAKAVEFQKRMAIEQREYDTELQRRLERAQLEQRLDKLNTTLQEIRDAEQEANFQRAIRR